MERFDLEDDLWSSARLEEEWDGDGGLEEEGLGGRRRLR